MRMHPNSPPENVLGAGVSPADLEMAIAQSGYPLQAEVVDQILASIGNRASLRTVQEEWSFIDSDQDVVRHIDALLSFELSPHQESAEPGRPTDPGAYLRGSLDFLIECKQSELPFIFFVRPFAHGALPRVAGLPHEDLTIHSSPDDPGMVSMSSFDALGCYELPLYSHDRVAIAMTRTYRKAKKVELSGEEAYRGLTLPITKALSYYEGQVNSRSDKRLYHDVRMILPLAVLKAPMVSVTVQDGKPQLEFVPWVRLIRHEPGSDPYFGYESAPTAIDVIHVGFIEEYVSRAVDSANELISRVRDFAPQLLTGSARWSALLSDTSEEEFGGDDGAPYRTLAPHLSDEQFGEWLDGRWRVTHSSDADS